MSSQQLLAALEAAASPSQEVRQQGEQQLDQLKSDASGFFTACVEVLTSPSCPIFGRQLAGFQLKNNLSHPACAGNATVQGAILQSGVIDQQRNIRKVASSIVSLAVREALWPIADVVRQLRAMLHQGSTNVSAVHGVVMTLSKITDDCIFFLDVQQLTGEVMSAILPFLSDSSFGNCPEAIEIRVKAFDATVVMLEQAAIDMNSCAFVSLQQCAMTIMQSCFENLKNPPGTTIASKCITCIILALTFEKQIDDALFHTIIQLMYEATTSVSNTDETVRIAATEFWSAVLNFPRFAELSAATIERILPVLIKSMIYSDMEIGMLQASADDWMQPDKPDDIKPRHYQSKTQKTNDDDDDDDGDNEVEEWNLRQVSARTLDDISAFFGDRILMPTLTVIDSMMQPNQEWRYLEAAVLALGAISEGCLHALTPYLPVLCPQLLKHLQDANSYFLVVCITLWTCERFVLHLSSSQETLTVLVHQILTRMQSPSKKVQESATAALETVIDSCDEEIIQPYIPSIIEVCSQCLQAYQLKNRLLLLDLVSTVCVKHSQTICGSEASVQHLLGPLGEIWTSTPDDSIFIFSVFDCMSNVCGSLGSVIQPMAEGVFHRAFNLLQANMRERFAAIQRNEEPPDVEFLITSAVLLSGLMDGLGSGIEPLVAKQQLAFVEIVLAMQTDEDHNVRQSGFGLSGDMNKAFPSYIQSVLPQFCDGVIKNLGVVDESTYRVVSNVAWSVCNLLENEIVFNDLPTLRESALLESIYATMAKLLATVEFTSDMRNMAENIALALGIMLATDPEVERRSKCPAYLFSKRFCEFLRNMKDDLPQKTLALNGYLRSIGASTPNIMDHLHLFLELACSIVKEPPDTLGCMGRVLQTIKAGDANSWARQLHSCMPNQRTILYQAYGLS